MKDLATLRRRAEAGNVAAQAIVGLRYFYGDGTPSTLQKPFATCRPRRREACLAQRCISRTSFVVDLASPVT